MSEPPEKPRKGMVRRPTGGGDAGRMQAERVKTAKRRTASSTAWLSRQLNDPFVAEARAKGYRARAAFKLTEIDDRIRVLRRGAKVIDLGCAPGGWLQVAVERGVTDIVGIDLLPVDAVALAQIVQGDFTEPGMGERLVRMLGGDPDVVLSDMAPNTVGHRQTDHLRIMGLIEAAADFSIGVLKPGGAFVAKAFQGGETAELIKMLRLSFAEVRNLKPKASRSDSSEVFIVATGFKGSNSARAG
jgi:23S rRNA (uridine2552-2'-O)-methyltransferase